FYGVELDARASWAYIEHFFVDLEGAQLYPGDALDDEYGAAPNSGLAQLQATFLFRPRGRLPGRSARSTPASMQVEAGTGSFPATLVVPNRIGDRERYGDVDAFSRRNPAHRDDIVTVAPQSSRDEVQEACERARAAARAWAKVPAPGRAQVLARLARLLKDEKENLARFVSREIGKPIREARGSVQEAIDTAEFFQSEGRRLYGQTVPSELPNKELFTYRRPIGVVGVSTAGNFPIAVPSRGLVPAILCGNAAVWKPSDDAPGTAALFADLWSRAGLPDGVLNVVHGGGANAAGEFLIEMVDAGLLDKISFTGSTAVGRKIGEVC